MKAADFDYVLPESAIAQQPASPRDHSRLMVLNRRSGAMDHTVFHRLPTYLKPGDVLILNDTKVIPARLTGVKTPTGGQVELLLLHRKTMDTWECLARPARRLKPGARMAFGRGELEAEVIDSGEEGHRTVRFAWEGGPFEKVLQALGRLPLPPYIKEELSETERYQTVYAKVEGAKAAPTAGLHFTPELLQKIEAQGIRVASVTLHVGLGTFRPVSAERITDHTMHAEYFHIPDRTATMIKEAKRARRRIIAVGTTVARTLESGFDEVGSVKMKKGWTSLFIYPGYTFHAVDGLITNFHLPRSSLLMMVAAFTGRDTILRAYEEALQEGYRFFSFGDAMFII